MFFDEINVIKIDACWILFIESTSYLGCEGVYWRAKAADIMNWGHQLIDSDYYPFIVNRCSIKLNYQSHYLALKTKTFIKFLTLVMISLVFMILIDLSWKIKSGFENAAEHLLVVRKWWSNMLRVMTLKGESEFFLSMFSFLSHLWCLYWHMI